MLHFYTDTVIAILRCILKKKETKKTKKQKRNKKTTQKRQKKEKKKETNTHTNNHGISNPCQTQLLTSLLHISHVLNGPVQDLPPFSALWEKIKKKKLKKETFTQIREKTKHRDSGVRPRE